ncbi:hypothetical protein, partial [Pseudomonas sp. GW460-13]|uniref:hypothetical protein n=1 Tax=Pseudomonas sp. GW460-13 TaxID=2070590 RepID=UPI001C44307A
VVRRQIDAFDGPGFTVREILWTKPGKWLCQGVEGLVVVLVPNLRAVSGPVNWQTILDGDRQVDEPHSVQLSSGIESQETANA